MKKYYKEEKMKMSSHDKRSKRDSDYGMIHEDHNAPANLPQEKIMRYYPQTAYTDGMGGYIDDTVRGVDEQIDADNSGVKKNFGPEKY